MADNNFAAPLGWQAPGFDIMVEYKPGSTNIVTDALSRHDVDVI